VKYWGRKVLGERVSVLKCHRFKTIINGLILNSLMHDLAETAIVQSTVSHTKQL